ncbi:MAG: helix-turn-helix domain-containing protein [Methylocystis sp.]|uniref:helix-turn-helix domain-containing protein n=1 Tax=Sphingomonas sp. TaxID=28214 RepID=UPI0025CF9160|nr:AraC family transcriptional regulator [uncultured Hyphomicrobium sp.]
MSDPTGSLPGTETGPLNADRIELSYSQTPIAKGFGSLGMSAALWQSDVFANSEASRPACPHTHMIETCLFGGGESSLFIDGRHVFHRRIAPGSTALVRAGEAPRSVTYSACGQCMHLYLPDKLLQQSATEEFNCPGSVELQQRGLQDDPMIARMGRLVAQEIQAPSGGSQMMLDSVSLALTVRMLRTWSRLTECSDLLTSGLAPWQQKRTIEVLQSRYADDLSIADLAAEARLSPFHFIRSFKRSVGVPPHQYLTKIRLERACVLLETTNLAITDVAFETGYQSPAHFARLFRRHYGLTPTAYRRKART